MMDSDILIVDDEEDIRKLVRGILEDEGYSTRVAANAREAYAQIDDQAPALIILDIWLQESHHDGLEILNEVKKQQPDIPIVMISGHGTIETAVSALKDGAYDFIEKPFKSDRLLLMIRRALETAALKRENDELRKQRRKKQRELIGTSAAIQTVRQTLERVSQTNSRILLSGQPGTGKDVVAYLIHQQSDRAELPFMSVSCSTLSPERLELTLFGSSSARSEHPSQIGILEQADGGTVLLDEVADLPLKTQAKMIKFLQEGRFQKTDSSQYINADVRVLASTSIDLEDAIERGDFRQDLYYRLNVVPIEMPPLKNRSTDVQALAEHFIESIAQESGMGHTSLGVDALNVMKSYQWPGNIRQLRNVIEWLLIMYGHNQGSSISASQLPPELNQAQGDSDLGHTSLTAIDTQALEVPLREAREMFEKQYLQSQIERFDGNISQTAKFIGMERSALHRKLKSLNLINGAQDERKTA